MDLLKLIPKSLINKTVKNDVLPFVEDLIQKQFDSVTTPEHTQKALLYFKENNQSYIFIIAINKDTKQTESVLKKIDVEILLKDFDAKKL